MEPNRHSSQFRVTVEPVVFLFTLSFTLLQCIQQDFIFKRLCLARYPAEVCDEAESFPTEVEEVQKKAVNHVMWISITTSITAIVSSQFIGYAMDKYSRKVVLLGPYVGAFLQVVLNLLVACVPVLPIRVLYLGAALLGLSGGYVIFKSGTSSYVTNICLPEDRVDRLAILEALVFMGNATGPIILMVVVDTLDVSHAILFIGTECVLVLAILYILIFVPDYSVEALPSSNTDREQELYSRSTSGYAWSKSMAEVGRKFADALVITFKKRRRGSRTIIILIFVADFFIAVVFAAELDLLYSYLKEIVDFSFREFTQYLSVKHLINSLSLLCLLPCLRRYLCMGDVTLGILGGLSRTLGFLVLAFARSRIYIYVAPVLDVFGQYLFVVLRAVISNLINENEQGRVFTVLTAVGQLSFLAGSVGFDSLYPVLLAMKQPGLLFVSTAVSLAITTIILGVIYILLKQMRPAETRPLLDKT